MSSPLHVEPIAETLAGADLLVNTTAVGLHGEAFSTDLLAALKSGAPVYDMVYAPKSTPLLTTAAQQGRAVADGRGMLVAQGEAAFWHWFGQHPPTGVMRSSIFGT
jgi:shikimate dehydrogenase